MRVDEEAPLPDIMGTQVLGRALNLLFALRDEEDAIAVNDLGERLGLPQSNLYRLLQTLEAAGLVDRDTRGEVQLGLRLLELGTTVHNRLQRDVVPFVDPVMRSLTRSAQQTSLLTMRTGLSALCVHAVDSPRPIRLSFAPGRLLPLVGGASGRVLMPWLSERVLRHVLDPGRAWTLPSGQVLDAAQVRGAIARARADGYVVTRGEVDAGAAAIAAPVLLPDGRLWGGLSIAGPEGDFTDDDLRDLVPVVVEHAARLAGSLAGRERAGRAAHRSGRARGSSALTGADGGRSM